MMKAELLPVIISITGVVFAGGASWGIVKASVRTLSKRMENIDRNKVETNFCNSSMDNIHRELSTMRKEFNDKLDLTIKLLKTNGKD